MQPIEFYSSKALTEFTISVVDHSGYTQKELGGKLGMSQPAVNYALCDRFSDSIRHDGTRIRILNYFGYHVETKTYFKISK